MASLRQYLETDYNFQERPLASRHEETSMERRYGPRVTACNVIVLSVTC